jgi:gliding motility-associated-like protein
MFLMLSTGTYGAVFNIPNGDIAALIAAINTANTNKEADVINLAPNGLYILTNIYYTSPNPGTTGWEGQRGLPRFNNDVDGVDVIINGNGATVRRAATAPNFGIFTCSGQIVFNNLIVRNARVNAQGAAIFVQFKGYVEVNNCQFYDNESLIDVEGGGGAIYTKSLSELRVNNSLFEGNKAVNQGGAISNLLSDMYLIGCTFRNNSLTTESGDETGGAVYDDGARGDNGVLIVRNCLFEGNSAGKKGQGGGLFLFPYNNNAVEVTGCIFRNNEAHQGGGYWHSGGSLVLADPFNEYNFTNIPPTHSIIFHSCIFENNIAHRLGGGLWIFRGRFLSDMHSCVFSNNTALDPPSDGQGGAALIGTINPLTIRNCTFNNNRSRMAGGVAFNHQGHIRVINCTFDGNVAEAYGGAVTVPGATGTGTMEFLNCTFANNRSDAAVGAQGGAIFSGGGLPSNSAVMLRNCLFFNQQVNNTAGPGGVPLSRNCNCELVDGGGNMFFPEATTGARCVTSPNIANPLLSPLANNGGVTPTMALQAGSPAINAGVTTGAPPTDQRGSARVGAPDIGAFEFGATACHLVVSSTADSGPNTLREAINCAVSGQTITFAPSLANQTITLASTLTIPVGKNLTIDGAAAPNLTISGNNAVRVFLLRSTSVNPTSLVLRNLRIINGYHTEYGAGIRSEHQGIMTIENCVFSNNNAEQGGSAIFSHFEGRATIRNCRFEDNVSIAKNDERGSTVMLWGPHAHTVQNCEFINNRGINGAGINGLNAGLLIEDCKFIGNNTTAAFYDTGKPNPYLRGFGAAIYTDRASPATPTTLLGSLIIRRCLFEGNRARGEGGACYLYTDDSDNVLIEDCYFNDNEVAALPGGGSGGSGGAIQHMNNAKNRGFVLRNTTFANNRAGVTAGAVRVDWADTQISNCTFFNNRALETSLSGFSANGGALAFFNMSGSTVDITHCTFANNYAGWVGGAIATSHAANTRIRNNIFFQNTAGNGGNTWNIQQHANAHLTDLGGNIQFPDKANNLSNNFNVSATVTIANPQLNPLANNGGFAPTMSLQATSPAIDFGVSTGTVLTDQTGKMRVGFPDAGAVEFGTAITEPEKPAAIVLNTLPVFDCTMSEAAIAATGAPRLTIGGSNYYIGTRQASATNQNPIIIKFTGGVRDWCREDYETDAVEGRGYGLYWSGTDLYAVVSVNGHSSGLQRFTGRGWLRHFTDFLPSGSTIVSGARATVIFKINPRNGEGMSGQGTFLTSRTTDNRANTLLIRDISRDGVDNLVMRANSWNAPRRINREVMSPIAPGAEPYDYTLIMTSDLVSAVCASAVGWDNGTGVDCSGAPIVIPTAPQIQVLQGSANIVRGTGSVNFGTTPVGTPVVRTFTIRNTGTATLTVGTLAALPAGFDLVGTFPTGTIAPGGSATFQLRLMAATAGSFSGTVSFDNDDSYANPFTFNISGTAAVGAPEIELLQGSANIVRGTGSVNFGTTPVGTPVVRTFTIRNTGTATLTVGTLAALPAGFDLVGTFPTGTIAPGGSATFQLRLMAATAGSFSGTVSFDNDDSDENPFTFAVSGTVGTSPSPTPTPTPSPAPVPPPAPVVTPPTVRFTLNAQGQPVLSWQTGQGTPQGFRVERRTAGSNQPFRSIADLPVSARDYTDTQTSPATLYEYRIVALPDAPSVIVQIATAPQAPQAVGNLTRCGAGDAALQSPVGGNGITFRWYTRAEGGIPFRTSRAGETIIFRADTSATVYVAAVFQNLESPRTAVNIIVLPLPKATVAGGTLQVFCGAGILSAETEPETSYEWHRGTESVGSGAQLTVTQSGIYRLTARRNGCAAVSAPVAVTVNPIPEAAFAESQPTVFCGSGELRARPLSIGSYEWRDEQGQLIGRGEVLRVSRSGIYRLTAVAAGCRSNTAELRVTVHPVPERPAIVQSGNLCEGGTVQLSTPTLAGASYEWRGPNGFTAREPVINIPHNPDAQGTYTLTVSLNGCRSEAAVAEVRFHEPIRYRIAAVQSPTCRNGSDGYFQAENLMRQPLFFSLNGSDWTQNFHFGDLPAGKHRLYLRSAEGCQEVTTVEIPEAAAVRVQVSADKTVINQFEEAQLQATGGVSYSWSPAAGLSATDVANPIARPAQTTTYTVRIRTAAGCETTASVTIAVAPIDITVRPTQKVVSPNGDGINDTWVVEHLERHERHYLRIVDRWGRTVYETRQYRNDWSAEGLPDGVYYYVLEVSGMPALSGAITVAR